MVMTGSTGSTTTTTAAPHIFGAGGAGGGTPGAGTGLGGIDWNAPVSTTTLAGVTIPILGAGGDPNGLADLIPEVGPGHAPLTVGARIASISKISGAKRNQLGALLSGALGEKAKKNYTVGQVQSMLSTAFRQTGQSGAANLSDWVTNAKQQSASAMGGLKGKGTGTATGAGQVTIPTPTATQTTYTTQDLQQTANQSAQKLVGRDATPQELQAITDQVNATEGLRAQDQLTTQEASTAANDVAANSGSQVDAFLAATRQHESGGDYKAYNKAGGASGAYQYIQSTWSSEAHDAGYGQYANGPASAAPPAVQDAVARFNAMNLYNKFGNWKDVAESWYYPAWAGNPTKQNSIPYPSAGNTETLGQYGDQIVSMMGSATPQAPPSAGAMAADTIVQAAQAQLGTPYVWGGEDPTNPGHKGAFDCSGLVQWAYGQNGVKLPRVAQAQYQATQRVAEQQAQPGDLVFFGTGPNDVSHVGIYIGNGQMIDAPHTGAQVRTENIHGFENIVGFGRAQGVQESSSFALTQAVKMGGGPYLAAMANQANIMQNAVNQPGLNAATLTTTPYRASPAEVADAYFMNNQSSAYQTNNLVGVFSKISDSLKAGGAQAAGVGGAPIDMRAQA